MISGRYYAVLYSNILSWLISNNQDSLIIIASSFKWIIINFSHKLENNCGKWKQFSIISELTVQNIVS